MSQFCQINSINVNHIIMSYRATTERQHKPRSGLALGGMGAGWFEIRQDGRFYNWNIFNNRPSGRGALFTESSMPVLFFLLRYQVEGQEPRIRLLEIEDSHGSAGMRTHEFHYIFPWLDGVDRIEYDATVPFANLKYQADGMPFEVKLSAWSPFIPHDAYHSALPITYFDFTVVNQSSGSARVTLLASMRNCVGYDVLEKTWSSEVIRHEKWAAFQLTANGINPIHSSAGTMGMASLAPQSRMCVCWGHLHPFLEKFLRQPEIPEIHINSDHLNKIEAPSQSPRATPDSYGSIGCSQELAPQGVFEHSFCMYWDFPNRHARTPDDQDGNPGYLEAALSQTAASATEHTKRHIEGHFYSNHFDSPEAIAAFGASEIMYLRERTRAFHDAYYESTLPNYLLDQVNSHFNTFRTGSWYTRAGDFGIVEGMAPNQSYAGLTTTDVAMYGAVATAALFPKLDRVSLLAHLRFQNDDGSVCHAINHNFLAKDPNEASAIRVDMPGQYAYMILRAGLVTGDREFLASVWSSAQRALEYILRERDANQDMLPDMDGIMCSYDNFPMYGIAPYVATQWLAAIRAAVTTARILGDAVAAERYGEVLERGTKTLEDKTWNGSYYNLYDDGEGDLGCLTDQMIGQWACHVAGLPPLLNPERVQTALQSIMKMNYRPDQGLRNCQWPNDTLLHDVPEDCWVDQANTCWTGVELAFASLLIYENRLDDGLMIVRNVDERYRRWGMYWDHQEYGGHYFRPMSAWSIIPALLGYSAMNGIVTFAPRIARANCCIIFMTADGYGHYEEQENVIRIKILSGTLSAREIRILKPSGANLKLTASYPDWVTATSDDFIVITVPDEEKVVAGSPLEINYQDI